MADPFLGEIRLFGFGIVPTGWMQCAGQIMSIQQNQALYSLLGTTYGGDGKTTFALPDLCGRAPLQVSSEYPLGRAGGEEAHCLTEAEMPAHTHQAMASTFNANVSAPINSNWANRTDATYSGSSSGLMAPNALGTAGNNEPHPNLQPYLALNFCIAIQGLYPPRN